jgi:MFS family permease
VPHKPGFSRLSVRSPLITGECCRSRRGILNQFRGVFLSLTRFRYRRPAGILSGVSPSNIRQGDGWRRKSSGTEISCPAAPMHRGRVVVGTGLGNFAFSLQSAAVLIALPYISPFLHGIASSEWTATAYLFSITVSLLVCGRIGDSFGNRRIYLGGLILFTLGSFFCGMTGNSVAFLISRALQGVGAALSAAHSPAIITRWLPGKHYGSGFGWQSALTYSGLCLGPVAAAVLITHLGWRSIFLTELPIGIMAVVLGFIFIPADDVPSAPKLSFPSLSGLLWLGCLIPILTLFAQGNHGGWKSARVSSLLAVWVIAIASFCLWEARTKVPLVNFRLRGDSAISLALASEAILYFCIYMIGFFIPLLLIRGTTPRPGAAGLILTIQGIARFFGAAIAGIATDRCGPVPVAVLGSSFVLAGSISYCMGSFGIHLPLIGAGGFLVGFGAGVFVPANSLRLFANVANDRHGVAAGVFATVRNLGMMMGMSSAAALTVFFRESGRGVDSGITFGLLVVSLIAFFVALAHLVVGVRDYQRSRDRLPLSSKLQA